MMKNFKTGTAEFYIKDGVLYDHTGCRSTAGIPDTYISRGKEEHTYKNLEKVAAISIAEESIGEAVCPR